MARRSDHTRLELETMIVDEGHRQMEEVGFARFSAREIAKRIGYSIGTIYNVFSNHDRLVLAVNARTLAIWTQHLEDRLAAPGEGDRIACLVHSYFGFARAHPNAWAAIYDHRLPAGTAVPDWYNEALERLTGLVFAEVAAALPKGRKAAAPALARSLLANVHGHCVFAMNGTFILLGEMEPADAALARVREGLAAAKAD